MIFTTHLLSYSWQSACTNTDLFKWIKGKTKLKDLYTLFEAKMASNSGPSSGGSTPKLFRAHAKGKLMYYFPKQEGTKYDCCC